MPAPTNISFLTATDVGAVSTTPINITQDVRDGGINYTVYYKLTAPRDGVIEVFAFGAIAPGYQPVFTPYLGPAGSPVLIPVDSGGISAINQAAQFPVVSGNEYFLKFLSNTGNTPTTASLALRVALTPDGSLAVNDIFIPDDTYGFPGAILDPTTGLPKKFFIDFPAGEEGVVLPNGRMMVEANTLTTPETRIYDKDCITILATIAKNPKYINRSELGNFFAAMDEATDKVYKYDDDGNELANWTISNAINRIAVSPDETILYYILSTSNNIIRKWDLVGNVSLGIFATTTAGYNFGNDILILTDGTLITTNQKTTVTRDANILHYSAAGAVLTTHNLGSDSAPDHLAYGPSHPTSFVFWEQFQATGIHIGFSKFHTVRVSDLVFTVSTPYVPQFENGVNQEAVTATPTQYDGHSFSCPLLVLLAVPASLGTIIVDKITVGGDDDFDFIAGGGLSPTSFSLANGESQQFDNVTAGSGYTISEAAKTGWTTEYVVSNGSPINNIVVGAGEVVTITVTNTKIIRTFSGIYKIVAGKRNDTLWGEDFAFTVDVKIP